MPVGTQASVKALDPRELREMGTQIILGNTYHLNIRPGMDIIHAAGGLHRFMNWPYPILTDSGGFQVFSLAKIRKVKAHGVEFRSHLDGSPALSRAEGSDGNPARSGFRHRHGFRRMPAARRARQSAEGSPWSEPFVGRENAANSPAPPGQAVFGIVQGGSNAALREECAKALVEMDFDGYAIGGVSVGEPEPEMMKAVEITEPLLPAQPSRAMRWAWARRPRWSNWSRAAWTCSIVSCRLGVARNGTAFTRQRHVHH